LQGYIEGFPNVILTGGRYDKLFEKFGVDTGAVGFAILTDGLKGYYKDTDKKDLSSQQLEFGFTNWRYFEFSFIPVELISRLYEEFLGEQKKEKGLFYT